MTALTHGERYRQTQTQTANVLTAILNDLRLTGMGCDFSEVAPTPTSGQRLTFMAPDGRRYSLTLRAEALVEEAA